MTNSPQLGADQRKYQRIQLSVPVKFLGPTQEEAEGTLLDISAGGLALATAARPEVGSPIVAYVQSLGRMEGHVVRHLEQGFAIQFDATEAKRSRLTDRLDWVKAQGCTPQATSKPTREAPIFVLGDGRAMECRVLDMSVNGVRLQVKNRPPLGEEITIGRMRGRVSHHLPNGIAIEFMGAHT